MSGSDFLKVSEKSALVKNQFVSNVTGEKPIMKKTGGFKAFGATIFIALSILIFAVFFNLGSLIPTTIAERLVEQTDVQYADAVESKKIVFQQAMYDGSIPNNTIDALKLFGVETLKDDNGSQYLKMGDKIITADNFIREVSSDVRLYDAFNKATYSRAAYYYDDSAKKLFEKLGTNRNNFTADSDFDEVMDSLVGSGSDIDVNTVAIANTTSDDGSTGISLFNISAAASTTDGAASFVAGVGNQNIAATTTEATLNSADALKVADTISKEQRSCLFYLGFMENISKMKAGDGNDSRLNDAMNYLTEEHKVEMVDVKTGEVITMVGTAMDSPSLYAVMTGDDFNPNDILNFSSDRIIQTVENRLGVDDSSSSIKSTIASSKDDTKGSISRLSTGSASASIETLNITNKTIDSSLINNSYKSIKGIAAGEFLVEGAVNTGKELAKASGATAGDSNAVTKYARLNSSVLAMDAAADRLNRSPFDVTSKNTFLGSIFYNVIITSGKMSGGVFANFKTFSNVVGKSFLSLFNKSYADASTGYLNQFGDCETYATIGAVGSAHCSEVATFDTSTLNDTFNDSGFIAFVNNNTTLSSYGTRTINKNSDLANFIVYNNERITPLGVTDGGILDSLANNSSSIGFMSDFLKMIWSFIGAPDSHKRVASGAAYVNSNSNPDWQTYKYAQRYVSLARATESLRQYANDPTAYNNIQFFEGSNNPVVAFLDSYYAMK